MKRRIWRQIVRDLAWLNLGATEVEALTFLTGGAVTKTLLLLLISLIKSLKNNVSRTKKQDNTTINLPGADVPRHCYHHLFSHGGNDNTEGRRSKGLMLEVGGRADRQ